MSQVRTEKIDIVIEDMEEVVKSCEDLGLKVEMKKNFNNSIEIKEHGIQTYGNSPIYVSQNKNKQLIFSIDLHMNRAENNKKFIKLKENVHSHILKNRAVKAAKKQGFTFVKDEESEDKITIRLRKAF